MSVELNNFIDSEKYYQQTKNIHCADTDCKFFSNGKCKKSEVEVNIRGDCIEFIYE